MTSYKIKEDPDIYGLSSSFVIDALRRLANPEATPIEVRAEVRSSSFPYPSYPTKAILVGNGVGIAPMMAFVNERTFCIKNNLPCNFLEINLIYGVKTDEEFLFKEEMEEAIRVGAIDRQFLAYSRKPSAPKKYCQDIIRENAELIKNLLLEDNAIIYICGSNGLKFGMQDAMLELLGKDGFYQLQSLPNKYSVEAWG